MTLTELTARVLQELGVIASGEQPNIADSTIVSDKYTDLLEMLLTEELTTWAADDDIPEFASGPVVLMLANLCARSFGVSEQRVAELEILGSLNLPVSRGGPSQAESQLRRQLARTFVYQPISTEYF